MNASPPVPTKRLGVFGGAFDPPHNAHLALAQAAVQQLGLDALHIIPTGQAWHKARALSATEHRLAMARLAFEGLPKVVIDERELKRAGPSFTIDTLEALQAENPGVQLYLIIGADQFVAFRQWHRWQDILKLAIICIACRAHFTPVEGEFDLQGQAHGKGEGKAKQAVLTLDLPLMPVSATQIRQLMASGAMTAGEAAHLVPEPVARYISRHRLYSPR